MTRRPCSPAIGRLTGETSVNTGHRATSSKKADAQTSILMPNDKLRVKVAEAEAEVAEVAVEEVAVAEVAVAEVEVERNPVTGTAKLQDATS